MASKSDKTDGWHVSAAQRPVVICIVSAVVYASRPSHLGSQLLLHTHSHSSSLIKAVMLCADLGPACGGAGAVPHSEQMGRQ